MQTFLILVMSLLLLVGCAVWARDMPKVGEPAPGFSLKDADGKMHALADYKDTYVALYFYPKNDTPGCTKEACNLRDNFEMLKSEGVVVLGVSYDSADSHQKFRDKYKLPFTLLADTDKAVSELYGVKGLIGPKRRTFIIIPGGKIGAVITDVSVGEHAGQISDAIGKIKLAEPAE